MDKEAQNFGEIKNRLDEIVDEVGDDTLPLDKALDLYEEAIMLGMQVSNLLEEDISAEEQKIAEDSIKTLLSEDGAQAPSAEVNQAISSDKENASGGEESIRSTDTACDASISGVSVDLVSGNGGTSDE